MAKSKLLFKETQRMTLLVSTETVLAGCLGMQDITSIWIQQLRLGTSNIQQEEFDQACDKLYFFCFFL